MVPIGRITSGELESRTRIHLLGGFRVEVAGREVPRAAWLRRGAARTLVKLLGAEPAHKLHREVILEVLWPEIGRESALNRLGKAVHAARHALCAEAPADLAHSAIQSIGGLLKLDPAHVWVDVDNFEELSCRATTTPTIPALEAALAAYSGSLLPADRCQQWTLWRRDSLSGQYVQLLIQYGQSLLERQDYTRTEGVWQAALNLEPIREDVHRRLMRLYRERRMPSRALRQYETCRLALQRVLGAVPEPETEALHRQLLTEMDDGSGQLTHRCDSILPPLPAPARRQADYPLVGHDLLRASFNADLRRLEAGTGSVLMIEGEPGIGKSRLLHDLSQRAHARGVLVLWGAGSSPGHTLPYSLFIDAFEGYARTTTAKIRRELSERYPLLSTMVPSLNRSAEAPWKTMDRDMLRGRLAAEFGSAFGRLAEQNGALLVLDDFHAADAPSLHLAERFMRSVGDHRWILAVAYRRDDIAAATEFRETVTMFHQSASGRSVKLTRLTARDHEDLVHALLPGGEVDPDLSQRIYSFSLGNPMYTVELLRALLRDGSLALVGGRWHRTAHYEDVMPSRMADLVADRLHQLGTRVCHILTLGAVLGAEFEVGTFSAIADLAFPATFSEEDLFQGLDQLLDAGLLEDRGQVYAFRQPIVREVLLKGLPSLRRAHLHAAVADGIERLRPGNIEALAYHYARTDRHDRAIYYLRQAGARAARLSAHSAAVESYTELVRHLELLGEDSEAAEARCRLGEALVRVPRFSDAVSEFERAVAIFAELDDQDNLAYATAQLAEIFYLRGSPLEGIARVLAIRGRLRPSAPTLSRAMLASALSTLYGAAGKYDDQLAEATGAGRLAALAGGDAIDEPAGIIAAVARGYALMVLDRRDEAVVLLRAALGAAERVNDLLTLLRAADALAWVYEEQGEMDVQEQYLETAFDAARRLRDPIRLMYMLGRRSWHFRMTGQWDLAVRHLNEALALETDLGPTWVSGTTRFGLGYIAYLRGNIDQAREHLNDALQFGRNDRDPRAEVAIQRLLALCDLDTADPTAAAGLVEKMLATEWVTPDDSVRLLSVLASARLELSDLPRARQAIEEADQRSSVQTQPLTLTDLLFARSSVYLAGGELDTALNCARHGRALARKLRNPYLEGIALLLEGRIHGSHGLITEADDAYSGALELFTRLGAQRRINETLGLQDALHASQRSA